MYPANPFSGAANAPTETIGWDDDSDEEAQPATPQQNPISANAATPKSSDIPTASQSSSVTLHKPSEEQSALRPGAEPRRSEEGSDASYDLVSGATSRAPGTPKEAKSSEKKDDDEEEDWE